MEIDSHKVSWEEEVKFSCKLYASANTAELEPCICKVSVRKVNNLFMHLSFLILSIPQETRGGRSYKKVRLCPFLSLC